MTVGTSRFIWRSNTLVLFATVLCLLAVTLQRLTVVDIVAGIPLILYLPGAALISFVDYSGRHLQHLERQVWVVASSIGLSILGGFLLNVTGGLTRTHWLFLIYAVVTVLSLAGWLRQWREVDDEAGATQPATGVTSTLESDARQDSGRFRFRFSLREVILFSTALEVVAAALVLSVNSESSTSRENFVQSWIVTRPVNDVASSSIQVGIRNYMDDRRTFVVHVSGGIGKASTYRVALEPGRSWVKYLSRYGDSSVTSTVALASQPTVILSTVYLATPVP